MENCQAHLYGNTTHQYYCIDGQRGESLPPKAFRRERLPPPLSRNSDTLSGKNVIGKWINKEFTLPLFGLFGKNTLPRPRKYRFPPSPGLFTPGSDRAHAIVGPPGVQGLCHTWDAQTPRGSERGRQGASDPKGVYICGYCR